MLTKSIRTLLWYLRRPGYYPQLAHEIGIMLHKRAFPHKNSRQAARQWCQQTAVSMEEAVETLTGAVPGVPLEQQFSEVFAEAHQRADQCPVQMGGPGNLDLLYALAENVKALNVIETGVAYGWSSLALLLSLRQRAGARLMSTDMPYPGRHNDTYVGYVVPEELRGGWTLFRCPDRQGVPKALKALDGSIDLCHYDSDKSWLGRMWAYKILWKALRPGGIFISDDIADNPAFKYYAESLNIKPIVVETGGKYVGILVKDHAVKPSSM